MKPGRAMRLRRRHWSLSAEEGLKRRFPNGAPPEIRATLDAELRLVGELDYAPFFLTVHEIIKYARGLTRRFFVRAAARPPIRSSAIALGSPMCRRRRIDLLFERFVSEDRGEPPDIDVDFEHERREEVIQHIYQKYGRERAGLAATVICYRGRKRRPRSGQGVRLCPTTPSLRSPARSGAGRRAA